MVMVTVCSSSRHACSLSCLHDPMLVTRRAGTLKTTGLRSRPVHAEKHSGMELRL